MWTWALSVSKRLMRVIGRQPNEFYTILKAPPPWASTIHASMFEASLVLIGLAISMNEDIPLDIYLLFILNQFVGISRNNTL
jgi:hypothetical protein